MYGIVVAAVVVPSLLAFRWRGKIGQIEQRNILIREELHAERIQHKSDMAALRGRFNDYRKIVETGGDTPADVIKRLRDAGKIPNGRDK